MVGLVPAIHVLAEKEDVDARHKAGDDGVKSDSIKSENALMIKMELYEAFVSLA